MRMKKMPAINLWAVLILLYTASCYEEAAGPAVVEKKEFISSFETVDDFSGFYSIPQGHPGTTFWDTMVWQNGSLVSHASLQNLDNKLSQAHFGLYAPPQLESGLVYNDDLRIIEVDGE